MRTLDDLSAVPRAGQSFLAAAAAEIALLDRAGTIEWVNPAWDEFCVANGGDPARAGIGISYQEVCDRDVDDPGAAQVGVAVRAALRGELPAPVAVLVACDSPTTHRLFDVLVSSRLDGGGRCIGATVTHTLVLSEGTGPDPPHLDPPRDTAVVREVRARLLARWGDTYSVPAILTALAEGSAQLPGTGEPGAADLLEGLATAELLDRG